MYLDPSIRLAILPLKARVAKLFDKESWLEVATLTDSYDLVTGHSRLLRSLEWGDGDYDGHVLEVLTSIVEKNPSNLDTVSQYADQLDGGGIPLSSAPADGPRYYIQPSVFKIPTTEPDPDLVAVMMPFAAQFGAVYEAIKRAALGAGLKCMRVDDMWVNSVLVQDIFDLIVRSRIVVCDFSGKNPNVFYEAGIAHTLGKHVVPITQSGDDIPADLRHHRYLTYLNNGEGLAQLEANLGIRLRGL
ncbi:hypothetical protein HGP14_30805 [Rhizobium sp. P32RR-XVIII]|uniref:hypothetical protein n=1 Tax=Rhizobium sp. P32RR-XVIII TaxID=2726738 RepID=UPI0014563E35|nr:hypothetical protein [Rhizobium sp. P32RR-XVIII]NLS07652.1 hypothetical protein [Rhizobium sp. P32RR-XVIII]